MIAHFGFGVLFITFLVTLYSVFAAIYGDRDTRRHLGCASSDGGRMERRRLV